MSNEIVVAQQHPTFPIVAAQLEQRLPSIQAFLGGNAQAADRFRRVVLQSLVRNPDLLNCTADSLVSAAAEAAQLGLEPSGAVGGAHIVRFKDRAQLLIDYRGLVELARRSNQIEDVWADVVREKDLFEARRGLRPDLIHEPDYTAGRSPSPDTEGNRVIHVYAVAAFKSGHRRFDVMSRAEIDAIRARSRAANNGPWVTDWSEMAKKTVMRRLCKTLPLTAQAKEVIAADEAREYGGPPATVEDPDAPTGSLVERLRAKRKPLGATEQPEQGAEGVGQKAPATTTGDPAPVSQPGDDGSPSVASTTPPAQDQPAVPAAGEAAPAAGGEADLARVSASPSSDQPTQGEGVGTGPASVSQPEGASTAMDAVEGAPTPVKPEASGRPPAAAPPVDSPLQALLRDPSVETFIAFARDVLGMEPTVTLADLTEADIDQVIGDAVDSEEEWAALYARLPSVAKAQLRAVRQHPRGRVDRGSSPREASPERQDAEQLRASLEGGEA